MGTIPLSCLSGRASTLKLKAPDLASVNKPPPPPPLSYLMLQQSIVEMFRRGELRHQDGGES